MSEGTDGTEGTDETDGRQLPWWPFAAAAAVAVVGVLAATLAGDPETSLRVNGRPGASGDSQGMASTRPWLANAGFLCVAHGKVSITDVTLEHASSMRVVDWGVGAEGDVGGTRVVVSVNHEGRVADLTRRAADGTTVTRYTHRPVTGRCSPSDKSDGGVGSAQRLVLSVARTADVGYADGIVVHSTSGSVIVHQTLALCAEDCPDDILDQSGTP